MSLNNIRLKLFRKFLAPYQHRQRSLRMQNCVEIMGLTQKHRILDLGGNPTIWDYVDTPQEITFLNLPGELGEEHNTHHQARFIEGDACDVNQFADKKFDVIFSNSVIEHVGCDGNIAKFANEARRLGKSYWIQTPAKIFPIEAHCGMLFWWYYPVSWRRFFIARWRKKVPAWTDMVEGTTVLTKSQLRRLFPEAQIHVERYLGIPKSYSAYYCENEEN